MNNKCYAIRFTEPDTALVSWILCRSSRTVLPSFYDILKYICALIIVNKG